MPPRGLVSTSPPSMFNIVPKPPAPSTPRGKRSNYYRSFDPVRRLALLPAADLDAKAFCLWVSIRIEAREPEAAELLRRIALDEYLAKLSQWTRRRGAPRL